MMSTLNLHREGNSFFYSPSEARKAGEQYAEQYKDGNPFPHIQFDQFLPPDILDEVLAQFPREHNDGVKRFDKGYVGGKGKVQYNPTFLASVYTKELFNFFNSEPFVEFLEAVTGISGLIPDPFFEGAGLHEIATGGRLGIHADFRIQRRLFLLRRINVLIYLNKDWQAQWGGDLELWDKQMTSNVKSIAPLFNRCVIFNTDADSFHGHPDPLQTPADVTRKSIALYYYTASRQILREVKDNGTDYRPRPGDGIGIVAERVFQTFKNSVRRIAPPILYTIVGTFKSKR
jgi:Rps23 Pro-64 3,4-dihydroxylase Tpa1-like proline 4-hydroxylase